MKHFLAIILFGSFLTSVTYAKQTPERYPHSLFSAMKWRNIGPFRGGRCLSVSGVVGKPNLYYMGATGGGVWRTEDAGNTWFPISDTTFHSSSVGALAVAPSDANVIYVGMGESAIRNTLSLGDGMYKTTDAGRSWKHIGLEKSFSIARIVVHPTNPDIAFVAVLGQIFGKNSERGLYRTLDGGTSWQLVLKESDSTGAVDVEFDPSNPRIMYASLWCASRTAWSLSSGAGGSGLFKSTDGGSTWKSLSQNPGMPKGMLGKICVAVSPANPDRVFAMIENEHGGLFRSDDGGEKWTQLDTNNNLTQRPWYFSSVFCDPKNQDVVYVMNVEFWRSVNGGQSFTVIGQEHGDNHDMWINPNDPNNFIIGEDGSAAITFNAAKSWSKGSAALPTGQFYHVNLDNDYPYNVYGAQQDWGSMRVPSRTTGGDINARDCYGVAGGEAGYIVPDPTNPDITYGGEYDGQLSKYTKSLDQYQMISPYPESGLGDGSCMRKYRFQWTYPIAFSPFDAKTIYVTSQFVHKTTDGGNSWQIISPDLTRNQFETMCSSGGPITKDNSGAETYPDIFAFAPSPATKGTLWAGTDDGLVYVTTDEGGKWTPVTPPTLPQWALISIIEPSHFDASTCYVAANRYKWDDRHPYLFKTTDLGKTWKQITDGIDDQSFTRVIREDPTKRGILYCGTEKGVYISFNDGAAWQSLRLNLPNTPVHDIQVQARDHDLVIATHGRSFWILDDITPFYELADSMTADASYLYTPRRTMRIEGYGGDTAISSGQNAPNGAIVRYYFNKKQTSEIRLRFLSELGDTIATYSSTQDKKHEPIKVRKEFYQDPNIKRPGILRVDSGMNQFVWDLRYDDAEETQHGMVLWGSLTGPKAIPGKYRVQLLRADTLLASKSFEVFEWPKIAVSQEELEAQLHLALLIRDTLSSVHRSIKHIREMRGRVESFISGITDTIQAMPLKELSKTLLDSLKWIEEDLIQVRIKAGEDALRFPVKLNDKLAVLFDVVKSADAKPTAQDYTVYEDLSADVGKELAMLKSVETNLIAKFNTMAETLHRPVIEIKH